MRSPVSRVVRRLGLAALGALLAGGAAAAPAVAADGDPQIHVDLDPFSIAQHVGPDSPGKVRPVDVITDDDQVAHDVTVSVDTNATSDVLLIEVAEPKTGCATADGVITCHLGDFSGDASTPAPMSLRFRVADGVKAGTVAKPSITVTSSNLGTEKMWPKKVTVVESAPDLVALPAGPVPAKAGDRVRAPIGFTNVGDEPADGVTIGFYAMPNPRYLKIVRNIDGCSYGPNPGRYQAICTFHGSFVPGQSYSLVVDGTVGLPVDIASNIPGPRAPEGGQYHIYFNVKPGTADRATGKMVAGHGLHAAMVARHAVKPHARDADPRDNYENVTIDLAPNLAHVGALGAEVSGRVGQSVTARVGVHDRGPADAYRPWVNITAPTGTVVTKLPTDRASCTRLIDGKPDWKKKGLGHRFYGCSMFAMIPAGQSRYLTLTLTIEDSTIGSDGSVQVFKGGSVSDPVDDSAPLRVKIGSAEPSASASAGDTSGGQGGSAGGSLPVTGARIGLFAGVGALVLLLGGALLVLARRRRGTRVS